MAQLSWGPIIGVVVGFLLSQLANVVAWLISSRKEKQLVRLLVALEIDQNLALLNDYWHNVSLLPDEYEEQATATKVSEVEADRLARRAVDIPLPVLSDKAFNSQLKALPKALDESDIRLTWRIYEEIAQVQTLHAWLLAVASESETGEGSFPSASRAIRSHGMESATFKTKKAGAIFDLRRTIQQLLDAGNPLGTSKSPSPRTPRKAERPLHSR